MSSKSISINLYDGTLNGIVSIEQSNSNELILAAPKSAALSLLNEPESRFFGVYLLLSDDLVYIGETTNYSSRIRRHLIEKKWWSRVVFITTTDDKLNESHIKYIERILIAKAKENNKLDSDNETKGNRTNVGRTDKILLENYLSNVLFLLDFINVNVFSQNKGNISYYKYENKNIAIIDKTTVKDFLIERGIITEGFGKDFSYTGPQAGGMYYTIDPDIKMLEKDWRIIINDKENYEIIIIDVPQKAIVDFGIESFNKKAEKNNKISFRINRKTLIDTSGFDFSPYIKKKYSYSE